MLVFIQSFYQSFIRTTASIISSIDSLALIMVAKLNSLVGVQQYCYISECSSLTKTSLGREGDGKAQR